jgi:hypothetical protein
MANLSRCLSRRRNCRSSLPSVRTSAHGRCSWESKDSGIPFWFPPSFFLYDYPQIAPESAGDLFDGTEIDEILLLRIMTLTDEEKREIRHSDDRARQILERTEAMPAEQFMKLHGAVRSLRPVKEDPR